MVLSGSRLLIRVWLPLCLVALASITRADVPPLDIQFDLQEPTDKDELWASEFVDGFVRDTPILKTRGLEKRGLILPKGSEKWAAGSTVMLEWRPGPYKWPLILYLKGDKRPFASEIPNKTGYYRWTIPAGVKPGAKFTVESLDLVRCGYL